MMKRTKQQTRKAKGLAAKRMRLSMLVVGLLAATQSAYAALKLADGPLTVSVSNGVEPNVMLLMDNSGSMKNIMWRVDPTFDPTNPTHAIDYTNYFDFDHVYPDWLGGTGSNGTTDTINVGKLHGSAKRVCKSDPVTTRNAGNRCLTLPDPARDKQHPTSGNNGSTTYVKNYVNFLFEYAETHGLFAASNNGYFDYTAPGSPIPQETRMGAARRIIGEMVSNPANDMMRFGLMQFDSNGNGGSLMNQCGDSHSTIKTTIDAMYGSTMTPLSEAYYDITKYFRGLLTPYASPIQYRCQKNVSIVITDGYPTSDSGVTDTYNGKSIQNWDGLAPTTLSTDFPTNMPPFSDGYGSGSGDSAGTSVFLDDLAKFGFDIDLMPDTNGTTLDLDGKSFDDPAYSRPAYPALTKYELRSPTTSYQYPAVAKEPGFQYLTAHTIGLATANQMLVDAAFYTRGTYASVDSADKLRAALSKALGEISSSAAIKSVAPLSISSGVYVNNKDHYVYTIDYNVADWSGKIQAMEIHYNASTNTVSFDKPIDLTLPSAASRNVKTLNSNGAVIDFDTTQANNLSAIGNNSSVVASDTVSNRISYLRGDQSLETTNTGGIYRPRTVMLGDVINSVPAYVGEESNHYANNMESAPYGQFVANKKSRHSMIYVSANDGAIHGFDVEQGGNFQEKIAFIPSAILDKLGKLTSPSYTHEYFADGSATSRDVFYNSAWHSVISTALGKGAQAVIGMDVTDPSTFATSWDGAWQFSDADDSDMGYIYTKPALAKMPNGKWAAIFPNGYNSDEADANTGSGKAVVFVRFFDGTYVKLDTSVIDPTGAHVSNNGMSAATPVDLNGDAIVDLIYATDIQGNVWKFSLGSTSSDWVAAANIGKLFSTCSSQPCSQPITANPTVGAGPIDRTVMVYFGSGKFLGAGDPQNTDLQTFYAVMDSIDDAKASVAQSQLQTQTIIDQSGALSHDTTNPDNTVTTNPLAGVYRIVSNNPVDYYATDVTQRQKGWKLDLSYNNALTGERVTAPAILRNGKVIFTTNFYTPSVNYTMNKAGTPMRCSNNAVSIDGGGWIIALDALSGARHMFSPFDTTGDNVIDDDDKATVNGHDIAVSGLLVDKTNLSGATLMTDANGQDNLLINSGNGIIVKADTDQREISNGGGNWYQF